MFPLCFALGCMLEGGGPSTRIDSFLMASSRAHCNLRLVSPIPAQDPTRRKLIFTKGKQNTGNVSWFYIYYISISIFIYAAFNIYCPKYIYICLLYIQLLFNSY